MKIFFSESLPDYSTYSFNYGIYCLKEDNSELTEIFNRGFLPYSGNPDLDYDIFYLARSLRVNLEKYQPTSENKRVNRKLDPLGIELHVITKSDFVQNTAFISFCQQYADARMGGKMPPARLQHVLTKSVGTHLFQFSQATKPVGYVLAAINSEVVQYWFSFFDLDLMQEAPLGKWMMWKVIDWAAQQNKQHVYLGTCYGTKSLYKVRDFKGVEFFDGYRWNDDQGKLKTLCKADAGRGMGNDFKQSQNQNEHLEQLLRLKQTREG